MTITRNSNDADGVNTFPATVETVGQTDIVISTPEGTQFGGNNIRVKAPAGHGLRKGDTVLIDSRGFLVTDEDGNDDAETATAPQTPAAPEGNTIFAMGDRVRIIGQRFNGRTGTVTNEYGIDSRDPEHANYGRSWVGVKLDQTASAYTPRTRQWVNELEFVDTQEPEAAPRNIQRGRGQIHAADVIEDYMPTPKCGGNRSAEGYTETSGPVTCKNCLKILAKEAETEQVRRLADVQRQNDARKAAAPVPVGTSPVPVPRVLMVPDPADAGRLTLEEALDAAYERVEAYAGDQFVAVDHTPVHEQRGERIEPGTLLRNNVTGWRGKALGEHGVFSGNAWIKVRLLNPKTGREMEGEEFETRWSLVNTVRVADTEAPAEEPPFEPAPVATALPEISQAALGYVKVALSRPYGMLPLHMRTGMLNKLRSVGLIETKQVPKGRWLGYGYQERDVLTLRAFSHFGKTMVPDTWRMNLLDALGTAEAMFRAGYLDRLGIAWPLMGAEAEAYSERAAAVMSMTEPVYGSAAAVLGESLRLTEQRDAARRREAERLAAPAQLLNGDDLYVDREGWKAASAAMDSVGKALAEHARARTAAVESVMGLGAEALEALRYAKETAAGLRQEAAERGEAYPLDRDTVFADNGEPMTYQNVRVPADLVTDYYGVTAITWRRGVNAAHRAIRQEQGK